jgi:hypothetical protein
MRADLVARLYANADSPAAKVTGVIASASCTTP